ncbi:amidinotransferase [Crenobacter sp. SG2305]|uniref:amidinotransferase n=1 Tax=Crenobacter oryzisoli TaxID=3056844 RepID=UPI0025AA7521|nr:amidinotransferase [Crenobacter sp. SG2305]MDN0084188.1 amidinotransferase [Crenobacter sp. SG2305]
MRYTHVVTRRPADSADPSHYRHFVATLLEQGLFVAALPAQAGPFAAPADGAVVLPELAILTPSTPAARSGEDGIAPLLARFRPTLQLPAGTRLDGGDVLAAGKTFLVGLSEHTNEAGIRELARQVEGYGYRVRAVDTGGRRLRHTVSYLGRNRLMLAEHDAGQPAFRDFGQLVVDEADAGGTLWLNETLLAPAVSPGTLARLQEEGLPVVTVDTRAGSANLGPASLALCF